MTKKISTTFVTALICLIATAQRIQTNWGDEFKLKGGSANLEVIGADKTGVYVKEVHYAMKSYFVFGYALRGSATLIKLDKSLAEVYNNSFNKELKGKEYEDIFFLKGKLFLLASRYSGGVLTVYAGELDKETGEMVGNWTEIAAWEKDDVKEDINFKPVYNKDSSTIVLVSSILGREKNNYEVRQFDEKLQMVGKPIALANEFDPKTFQLEDVIYASTGNVVLVGREYAYQQGKKKKDKFLDFVNYSIRIYDALGQQIKEINTTVDGKWMANTKVMEVPNKELVLAAFYSNEKKSNTINGMLVQRINATTGDIITTYQKDLNNSMVAVVDDDADEDETESEKKAKEQLKKMKAEEEGFSRFMRFSNFIPTADSGLIILAEKFNSYTQTYTMSDMSRGARLGNSTSYTNQVFDCGDIMISKINLQGNIDWLHVVPKEQKEMFSVGYSQNSYVANIYFHKNNWPFYAGLGVLYNGKSLAIIFNDHEENAGILKPGQKIRATENFNKSECSAIYLNPYTGKYTRSVLFSNRDVPTAMPRLGKVLGNDFYIVGQFSKLLRKSKIAVAKLTLK